MTIRIPLVTVFDSKGLRQAQFQLNKVSGNIENLGRNFAIAGAAFGGIAIGLSKSVKIASSLSESINAVNVAFGSSAKGILAFGKTSAETLGVSTLDFNKAAVRFSAFADRIVGAGNDSTKFIQDITTRASDFASVFDTEVAEALQVFQSGLAGEAEPLKRFGINLLDSEVKAFAMANGIGEVGRQLTETEKVQARYGLLMEATAKTQGDFANTSSGLANSSRILQGQITNLQGEIGDVLLPTLEQMMPVVQQLTAEFGEKLKVALREVDFESFLTSIMNTIVFLVEHIETITKVVTALFLLNTAYNVAKITAGLINVATVILGNTFVITAGKIGLATGALKLFRTALITTGIGALVVGLGFIIAAIVESSEAAKNGTQDIDGYGKAVRASGTKTTNAAVEMDKARPSINAIERAYERAAAAAAKFAGTAAGSGVNTSTLAGVLAISGGVNPFAKTPGVPGTVLSGGGGGGGSAVTTRSTREGFLPTPEADAIRKAVIALGETTVKQRNATINAVKQQFASQAQSFALTEQAQQQMAEASEAAKIAAEEAARQMEQAQQEATKAAEEAAQKEKDVLEERQRTYKSFLDSVSSTFGRIKDSILGAFTLPSLGTSTGSIIRNMKKLLDTTRNFASNITKLATMGLSPELLQQVIASGPLAGARLASALVAGGTGAISEISAGFAEFSGLSGQIATTGVNSAFQTPAQQTIFNIEVNGGLDSSASIGQAVVEAIKAYERTSGAIFVKA